MTFFSNTYTYNSGNSDVDETTYLLIPSIHALDVAGYVPPHDAAPYVQPQIGLYTIEEEQEEGEEEEEEEEEEVV